jgi:hypothetical protein
MGRDTWHESSTRPGWIDWCREHRGLLARHFLKGADSGQLVPSLFGSWYDVCGYRQCGYFLGHEVVKGLSKVMTLKELAVVPLDQFTEEAGRMLREWAL